MMPAFRISMSMGVSISRIWLAQDATELRSDSSSTAGVALPPPMLSQAISAFSSVRPVPITCAPRMASTRIVS